VWPVCAGEPAPACWSWSGAIHVAAQRATGVVSRSYTTTIIILYVLYPIYAYMLYLNLHNYILQYYDLLIYIYLFIIYYLHLHLQKYSRSLLCSA